MYDGKVCEVEATEQKAPSEFDGILHTAYDITMDLRNVETRLEKIQTEIMGPQISSPIKDLATKKEVGGIFNRLSEAQGDQREMIVRIKEIIASLEKYF